MHTYCYFFKFDKRVAVGKQKYFDLLYFVSFFDLNLVIPVDLFNIYLNPSLTISYCSL